MDRKTTEAYVDVFMYIRDILCPNFSPRFVMADYETAIKNAVNNVWPNATVNGCWFHYAQGVWKMHKSMHMSELTKYNPAALKSLRMLMCLPLLPGNEIPEGLRQTRLYITENGLDLEFNDLVGYINEFWIEGVGCETISVCGLLNRTNNAVESFYSEIGRIIGKHPGVWNFIVGWGANANVHGFGEPPSVKSQLLNLVRSIRTVMRIPLIFLNIATMVFKLILG